MTLEIVIPSALLLREGSGDLAVAQSQVVVNGDAGISLVLWMRPATRFDQSSQIPRCARNDNPLNFEMAFRRAVGLEEESA